MTKIIKVVKAQNLQDICLQVYGNTQQLFQLAKDNGLKVDSDVSIGVELTYNENLSDLRVINKIQRSSIDMINPAAGQSAAVNTVQDGQGNIFTDGLGNIFTYG